jgi:hypothetical protein
MAAMAFIARLGYAAGRIPPAHYRTDCRTALEKAKERRAFQKRSASLTGFLLVRPIRLERMTLGLGVPCSRQPSLGIITETL